MSEIRDKMLYGRAIKKLLLRMTRYTIFFNHLARSRNIAGLLLERRSRKEKEQPLKLIERRYLLYRRSPVSSIS
ncbi:MAG TPA: hypothetical protein VFD60_12385 [Nitrososphaeraceae archaeon]|nr:hypothetical protein [Nitrososphaeraceae archaeon]